MSEQFFLDGINQIIRRGSGELAAPGPIFLRAAEDLSVEFVVQDRVYRDLEQIEDPEARELIQAAIQEWQAGPRSAQDGYPPAGGGLLSSLPEDLNFLTATGYRQRILFGLLLLMNFPVLPLLFGGWLALTGRLRRRALVPKVLWALSSFVVAVTLAGCLYLLGQVFPWPALSSWLWYLPLLLYFPLALIAFRIAAKDYLAEAR